MTSKKTKSGKIPSRRRNPEVRVGYVDFPTKTIPSTGEGGHFVRLVVIDTEDDKEYMRRFVPCCGGYVSFMMDESFLGDDLTDEKVSKLGPEPKWDDEAKTQNQKWYRFQKKENQIRVNDEMRYFPRIQGKDQEDPYRYNSREFLAVFLLGATGWSASWRCRYEDLTREGKAFYDSVQRLYPGCELRLLSFLDT
jgi:hypothetical protein